MPRETQTEKDLAIGRNVERAGQTSAIVYAGASPRRLAFLQDAFPSPRFLLTFTEGGPEEHIDDVTKIAEGKINFAVMNGLGVREKLFANDSNVVIASDILTRPLMMYSLDRIPTAIIRRKPRGADEVRKTFSRINRASGYTDPFYSVETGTCVRRRNQPDAKKLDYTNVLLDPQRVTNFKTVTGFKEYEQAFDDFYSSKEYGYDGRHPLPKLTDIAGGLSLSILLIEGAVLAIDGIGRDDPQFRQVTKRALYKVLIGFSPDLLKSLRPDMDDFIDSWPWLEKTTALALGETKSTPEVQESIIVPPRRSRRTT